MNYKNKPINLLTDIKKIYSHIRSEASKHKNLVRITFDDKLKVKLNDIDLDSNFYFEIYNPVYKNGYCYYLLSYSPQSATSSLEIKVEFSSNGQTIQKKLEEWLTHIKYYSTLSIHPTDDVLKEYKLRFQKVFAYLDEDLEDDKPLKSETRNQVSHLIDKVIENLEVEESENTDVIESLRELNKQLPQMTKRQVKESLSWNFAKLYYKGVDVVNWIAKQGASAGFGHLLIEGMKNL